MGLFVTTKDIKNPNNPERKKSKKPKIVQTRSLSNSDIEKAGDKKNESAKTETE